ncbi:MAG: hypothetical protein JWO42_2898 [Chloroflexi bacterium]|nr:hypothetical protein [Chloroflexota bacterium]
MACDILCFSHLRWHFMYHRPHHLMSRYARERRVFYIEEPIQHRGPSRLQISRSREGVTVVVPNVPPGLVREQVDAIQRHLLAGLLKEHEISSFITWFYTPMAVPLTRELQPLAVIYDSMDELALTSPAPPKLQDCERELFARADLVFTDSQSMYESKRPFSQNVTAFPSSVDPDHFKHARGDLPEFGVPRGVPRPRLGYHGAIDERLDFSLVAGIADARPDWQLVLVGPVRTSQLEKLPRRPNIHYLGPKPYGKLPAYLAHWDVGILPFALNEATRFISSTQTLEILSAGKPVVATNIRDVVEPHGRQGLVQVADTPESFVDAAAGAMGPQQRSWDIAVDALLATTSWQQTWDHMQALVTAATVRHAWQGPTDGRPEQLQPAESNAIQFGRSSAGVGTAVGRGRPRVGNDEAE